MNRCMHCDKRVLSYQGSDGLDCPKTQDKTITRDELWSHLVEGTKLVGCDEFAPRETKTE
jgi:hypothetical protein